MIVDERGPGVSQDDVGIIVQDTHAGLQIAWMIQIVVGRPLEQGRSRELEDSVEIGNRAQVPAIPEVADTWVALGERLAYLGSTVVDALSETMISKS